jgi:hypothetical protein
MREFRSTWVEACLVGSLLCAWLAWITPEAQGQPARRERPKVYQFAFVKADDVSVTVFNNITRHFATLFEMSQKMEIVGEKGLQAEQEEKARQERRQSAQLMPKWLEEADSLLWTGKDQIVRKEYEGAVESLMAAKKLYEENYLELRDYDKLVDATLQVAIAYFEAGYGDDGEEFLKDVLVWRPDLSVDPKKYAKTLVDGLNRLKGMMARRIGGVVRVEVTPADSAQVFVDGILKGTLKGDQAGLDVEGLPRGTHYVQVIRDGFAIFAERIVVPEEGRTLKVVAQLKEQSQQEVAAGSGELDKLAFEVYQHAVTGDFDVEFGRKAADFAGKAQVPYLLFGFVSKEPNGFRLTLFLFKPEWTALAELDPVIFDNNLANLQVNLLFAEANLAEALNSFPKNKVVRGKPLVYVQAQVKPEPVPVPVVVPETRPERSPVVVAPTPVPVETVPVRVVQPEPRVDPTPVPPRTVERDPAPLPPRTDPRQQDLGELSSIFAGGGTSRPGGKTATPDAGGRYATPGLIPTVEDKKPGSDSITGKWWFWAGVAAGVGVLGGGTYLLIDQLGGSDGPSKYSATVKW